MNKTYDVVLFSRRELEKCFYNRALFTISRRIHDLQDELKNISYQSTDYIKETEDVLKRNMYFYDLLMGSKGRSKYATTTYYN